MFGTISNIGITDVWLFADNYGDLDLLQQFSYAAWANAWLFRMEQYVIVVYQCAGNCTTCNWPYGNWEITNIYYGSQQWVNY